jgi:hypothetical protein
VTEGMPSYEVHQLPLGVLGLSIFTFVQYEIDRGQTLSLSRNSSTESFHRKGIFAKLIEACKLSGCLPVLTSWQWPKHVTTVPRAALTTPQQGCIRLMRELTQGNKSIDRGSYIM